jgi:hypothetical protein
MLRRTQKRHFDRKSETISNGMLFEDFTLQQMFNIFVTIK